MDITSNLCIYDNRLKAAGLDESVRANLIDLTLNLFSHASELPEISDMNKLVDMYANEIVEVVSNNKQNKEVCKKYAKFAINKIIEKVKEK